MKRLFAFLFLIGPLFAATPFRELPLQDIKASIQVPEGWTENHEIDDDVFVYHVQKSAEDPSTSITLSVTTKVPERTEQSPSQYAAALIEMAQEPGANVIKGELNGLPTLRVEYDFEGGSGAMHAVNVAVANDKTGTLYFFAWQAPLDEAAETEAIREKILTSARFDPAF